MKRILNIAAVSLLAAVILSSCEPGPAGLFALLEQEKPLNKGTAAFNANTAAFVTRLGTDYYASVGNTLFHRPASGGAWQAVTIPNAPVNSVISSAVIHSGSLYLSFAPGSRSVFSYNGTAWTEYFQQASLPDEPVQSLLSDGVNLYAATQRTTTDKKTLYTISYSAGGGPFSKHAGVTDVECGKPNAVAIGGGFTWITAGNTVFKGTDETNLSADPHASDAGISVTNPVFSLIVSAGSVIASGTGRLFKLEDAGYTPSGTFGSATRRLSSVVIVPANAASGATNAVLVGVKSWASDKYTGYYEYDALLNAGAFGSVVPSAAYDMVSDNSNYVTTLDDLSIEGFYFDDTPGEETLFARTVGGGLWSNTYSGGVWSGWDRE